MPRNSSQSGSCMVTEAGSDLQLEIGHVLFMDMVGYSRLLADQQHELQRGLTEIVQSTEQVCLAEAAGKLIRIPAGDGMALVFFNSPEAPVRCALEISKKLKEHPQLQDLGECEVKHGVRIHMFNLYTGELGNPELPEKFRHGKGRKRLLPKSISKSAVS